MTGRYKRNSPNRLKLFSLTTPISWVPFFLSSSPHDGAVWLSVPRCTVYILGIKYEDFHLWRIYSPVHCAVGLCCNQYNQYWLIWFLVLMRRLTLSVHVHCVTYRRALPAFQRAALLNPCGPLIYRLRRWRQLNLSLGFLLAENDVSYIFPPPEPWPHP